MKNQKQKDKKRKEREKKVQTKLQRRREYIARERKADEEMRAKEAAQYELENGKKMPFIKDPKKAAELQARKEKSVSSRLKKNLEILEALEAEYEQEHARRTEVHDKLEAEGHMSIKDKMNALHQKALEIQGLADKLSKAKEEYAGQQEQKAEEVKSEN